MEGAPSLSGDMWCVETLAMPGDRFVGSRWLPHRSEKPKFPSMSQRFEIDLGRQGRPGQQKMEVTHQFDQSIHPRGFEIVQSAFPLVCGLLYSNNLRHL